MPQLPLQREQQVDMPSLPWCLLSCLESAGVTTTCCILKICNVLALHPLGQELVVGARPAVAAVGAWPVAIAPAVPAGVEVVEGAVGAAAIAAMDWVHGHG